MYNCYCLCVSTRFFPLSLFLSLPLSPSLSLSLSLSPAHWSSVGCVRYLPVSWWQYSSSSDGQWVCLRWGPHPRCRGHHGHYLLRRNTRGSRKMACCARICKLMALSLFLSLFFFLNKRFMRGSVQGQCHTCLATCITWRTKEIQVQKTLEGLGCNKKSE